MDSSALFKKKRSRPGQASGLRVAADASGEAQPSAATTESNPVAADDPPLGRAEAETDPDGDGNVVVRRSKASDTAARRPAVQSTSSAGARTKTTALFGVVDEGDDDGFVLRRSKLASQVRDQRLGRSLDDEGVATSAPSSAGRYQGSDLAALKASTLSTSFRASGSGEAGPVETSDGSHGGAAASTVIPDAAGIEQAKEQRKHRAAEDFIPIGSSMATRSAHARTGADDFGLEEYDAMVLEDDHTALTSEAPKREAEERRRHMRDAIESRDVQRRVGKGEAPGADDDTEDEDDEDAMAWEAEQLSRWTAQRNEVAAEDKYKSAQVPQLGSLPTVTTASVRVQDKLSALQASVQARTQIIQDSQATAEKLRVEENSSRQLVQDAEAKSTWYAEFRGFAEDLAQFLDAKYAAFNRLQEQRNSALLRISQTLEDRRLKHLEDLSSRATGSEDALLGRRSGLGHADAGNAQPTSDPSPFETSLISVLREDAELQANLDSIQALFDDVQAPEFRHPAARAQDESGALHPRSIIARFSHWRRHFTDDYSNAWGGLAAASACDFWIRKETLETIAVDVSAFSLEQASVQSALHDYATSHHGAPPGGGDEELVEQTLSGSVLPVLLQAAQAGMHDPWDASQGGALVQHLTDMLDVGDASVKAAMKRVVEAFLQPYARWSTEIARYKDAKVLQPGVGEGSPGAELTALAVRLRENRARWARLCEQLEVGEEVG